MLSESVVFEIDEPFAFIHISRCTVSCLRASSFVFCKPTLNIHDKEGGVIQYIL